MYLHISQEYPVPHGLTPPTNLIFSLPYIFRGEVDYDLISHQFILNIAWHNQSMQTSNLPAACPPFPPFFKSEERGVRALK